jgi:hypothetical protein
MLENAIRECPDHVWGNRAGFHEFWYMAYHTLFWLDYDLSGKQDDFRPPAPFGIEEFDPAGAFPPRAFTKDELLTYLNYNRENLRNQIAAMTDEDATRRRRRFRLEFSMLELYLRSLRHVQHHTAQLNLLLRQQSDSAPGWIG